MAELPNSGIRVRRYKVTSRPVVVSRVIEENDGGRNVKEDVERIFLDKWLSRPKRKRRENAPRKTSVLAGA